MEQSVLVPLEKNRPGRPSTIYPEPIAFHEQSAIVDAEDADRVLAFAWTLHKARSGLYVKRVGHGTIMLHRFVLSLPRTPGHDDVVDHIDGDGLNCRRSNLRICTNIENLANSPPRKGSSEYKGVTWNSARGKWQAQIMVDRHNRYLGRYKTEVEAAAAYNAAALEAWGEHARLNIL